MLTSSGLLLCLCFFVVGSYGSENLVPFIDKCLWSDKACLVASTTKAIPYFAKGFLGVEPMDPLKIAKVSFKEGGMRIKFTNMDVTGLGKCKVLKVERIIKKNSLICHVECPIDVAGDYDADGDLLFTKVEGNGPFHVNCEGIFIAVEVEVTTEVGKDGVKYWKIGKATHTYEARKRAMFQFDNLFNGDQEKSIPVMALINDNWAEMMQTFGKPIVHEAVNKIVNSFRSFSTKVPADQLEK